MFFMISLLTAHCLSWACYSYTLPASITHSRYIRPAYFIEDNISHFSHPEHLPTSSPSISIPPSSMLSPAPSSLDPSPPLRRSSCLHFATLHDATRDGLLPDSCLAAAISDVACYCLGKQLNCLIVGATPLGFAAHTMCVSYMSHASVRGLVSGC
jgi:hypothetical protein